VLTHTGGNRGGEAGHAISVVTIPTGKRHLLSRSPSVFGPPSWSFDGSWLAYGNTLEGQEKAALMIAGGDGSQPESVALMPRRMALAWSPTQPLLAIASTSFIRAPLFEEVRLFDVASGALQSLIQEPLAAFFWSPDGNRIVYVAFDAASNTLTWKYVERSGERTISLVEFVPSTEFLTMITFFEQYAYSNSIWSPDGSKIVFSGIVNPGDQGRNGASPDGMKAHVLDVREGATPREIATSQLAVWSWR
jgi:Tol biopolymer transport system component